MTIFDGVQAGCREIGNRGVRDCGLRTVGAIESGIVCGRVPWYAGEEGEWTGMSTGNLIESLRGKGTLLMFLPFSFGWGVYQG